MMYVIFSPKANSDIKEHGKSGNKVLLRKLSQLLKEIATHPYSGAGKPEHLKPLIKLLVATNKLRASYSLYY